LVRRRVASDEADHKPSSVYHYRNVGEALGLGEASGLRRERLLNVIANSAPGSPVIKAKAQPLAWRDVSSTFSIDKDEGLICSPAAELHIPTPYAQVVSEMFGEESIVPSQGW
jgi:3-hydroxyisobutyrate dehydrogenase-like beta-hydroxyacid dehydrogenase